MNELKELTTCIWCKWWRPASLKIESQRDGTCTRYSPSETWTKATDTCFQWERRK